MFLQLFLSVNCDGYCGIIVLLVILVMILVSLGTCSITQMGKSTKERTWMLQYPRSFAKFQETTLLLT